MTTRPKTKYSYRGIPEHSEALEVHQYVDHKRRANNQIALTFGVLKSLHLIISEAAVRAYKGSVNKQEEDKKLLPEHLACVVQEFVQKQHIYAKRYLLKLKKQEVIV